jgi:hypothetical protein
LDDSVARLLERLDEARKVEQVRVRRLRDGRTVIADTRRRRLRIIALIAVGILLLAEGAVRLRAAAMPLPQKWSTPDMARKEQQMRELAEDGGASVVFLGSSTVDSGFDPSIMSTPKDARLAYNAGLRGGTVRMVSWWGRIEALPRLKPDVVVLGVAGPELNASDPEQAQREVDFFKSPRVSHALDTESFLQRAERYAETASSTFTYRSIIRQPKYIPALLGLEEAPPITQTEYGDYIAPDGQFQFFLRRRYETAPFEQEEQGPLELAADQLTTVRRLIDYLSKEVGQVVVVNMPVTKDTVADGPRERKAYDQIATALKNEAMRANASYIHAGIWPNEFFADPVHVNARGSERLTKLIERSIETLETGSR